MHPFPRISFLLLIVAAAIAAAFLGGCTPAPAETPVHSGLPASTPVATLDALAAAGQPGEASPTPPALVAAVPSPTAAPTLQKHDAPAGEGAAVPTLPGAPAVWARYGLTATLDYTRHTLAVDEWITYTNTTPEHLVDLPLVVEARRYENAFNLESVYDAAGIPLRHRWRDTLILHIALPEALPPAQTLGFGLRYSLQLPDSTRLANIRPYPLGYTPSQANLGDWYPFLPPYQPGNGWLIRPPAIFGEHLVYDIADYQVTLRYDRPDLVIAAPALPLSPAQPAEDGIYEIRYTHPAARNFAFSASPFYQVITRTVDLPGGQVQVAGYHFQLHAQASQAVVDTLARALPIYSQHFGVYPRPLLSAVQADFLDGMEYDGLFFLSSDFFNWHKDTQADFLVALSAHEAAHQWWGSVVGNDQAQQPWLDEALCTYSEVLYYQVVAPEALDWWWTYRVNYYEPEGPVDRTIYEAASGQYQIYRNPVYLRGALFLEELRGLLGDETFFAVLKDYTQQFAYRISRAEQFWQAVGEHPGVSEIKAKYFR